MARKNRRKRRKPQTRSRNPRRLSSSKSDDLFRFMADRADEVGRTICQIPGEKIELKEEKNIQILMLSQYACCMSQEERLQTVRAALDETDVDVEDLPEGADVDSNALTDMILMPLYAYLTPPYTRGDEAVFRDALDAMRSAYDYVCDHALSAQLESYMREVYDAIMEEIP